MVAQDVIGHLIDVERLAYDLLLDAQTEADRRKTVAKEEADRDYRSAYEKIIARLETKLAKNKQVCDERLAAEYVSFDEEISSITKDITSFSTYLDSIFSGS